MRTRIMALLAATVLLSALLAGTGVDAQAPPDPSLSLNGDSKYVEPSPSGSYIVVMEADPVVGELGVDNLDTPAAEALSEELEESHDDVLDEAGANDGDKIQDYTIALNGFAARLTHEEALAAAAQDSVRMVVPDQLYQPDTDSSGEYLGLAVAGGAYDTGLTGKGVVVGVIDSGIWPEHPSFADNGLPAPPVTLEDTPENPACEFGNTDHNPNDVAFTCNNKLIGARQTLATYRALVGATPTEFDSARDDNGHGTHTASTAAGNANVPATLFGRDMGTVSGIAPDAHIIAYKGLGDLGGFGSDLAAAIDQAVADGVDVINYSVGGGAGLGGADDIAFLYAADAGVFVATSAGNSGPGPATVGSPGDAPWTTTVGASTQRRTFVGWAKLQNGPRVQGISITPGLPKTSLVDAEDAGNELCLANTLDSDVVTGKVVLCRRGSSARAAKSAEVARAGGVGMILYNNDNTDTLLSDNHVIPSLHVNLRSGTVVKQYIADNSDPHVTLREPKAVARRAPVMAQFSSRGENPSSSDIIKPDITAPGVQILAGETPFPQPGGAASGELFQAIAGTSMSSPHVAGVFALIKQAHPGWSPAMAKSAIMTSANLAVKNHNGKQATPFDRGAGHLRPGIPAEPGSAFNPGLVYDAGFYDYVAFLCDATTGIVSDGFCGFLVANGYSTDASNLNIASIGIGELAGSQTVTRTVTSVADVPVTYQAYPSGTKGYIVTVNPSTFTVNPGETQDLEITFTNDGSGRLGTWTFGLLNLKGEGGYRVTSPIAVRGSLLDTPPIVSPTGTSGAASIDVTFGYTGEYSAVAHGMQAPVQTIDTVIQDPDQTFDPSDGTSNAHQFDLTDTQLFRLLMPPGSAADGVDLDVFVYGPDGTLAASSTAGGTDESIEIPNPADGVWTVYIHGWQTVGASADYTMTTWVVPEGPGAGTLQIVGAPSSAVIGGTGSVDVTWDNLDEGVTYLGVVSHHGPYGRMAQTMIEISN